MNDPEYDIYMVDRELKQMGIVGRFIHRLRVKRLHVIRQDALEKIQLRSLNPNEIKKLRYHSSKELKTQRLLWPIVYS